MKEDNYWWKIMEAVEIYGGSFAKALAVAWNRADPGNKIKIQDNWADMFSNYDKFIK